MKYTPEQIKDIEEREAKGIAFLKELELTPASYVIPANLGQDVFGLQVKGFLQDTKYAKKEEPKVVDAEVVSPVQSNDLPNKEN
jgi:hypothetical protein